jgi:hypothetical protein
MHEGCIVQQNRVFLQLANGGGRNLGFLLRFRPLSFRFSITAQQDACSIIEQAKAAAYRSSSMPWYMLLY